MRFAAEVDGPPLPALDCNCSMCRMTGFLHIVVPHEKFELITGRAASHPIRPATSNAIPHRLPMAEL